MGIKTFTLRLNSEHHKILERKAKEAGLSKNDYIRMLLESKIQVDKQGKILEELLEIKNLLKKALE